MPAITLALGAALIVLGFGSYFLTHAVSLTALIPAAFGLLFVLAGLAARSDRWRMHAMHGAALIALLGLIGSARGLLGLGKLFDGTAVRPAAIVAQSIMAILMLGYIALSVRSFISARRARRAAASLLLVLSVGSVDQASAQSTLAPTLISSKKIWDAGAHNAFTDLIRWRERWFCTFREADAHVGGNGTIRVLTSTDGAAWTSAALVAEPGIDLRDPKMSITPDDRLMIVAGGSVYEGTTYKGRQPRVLFSSDGSTWSAPARILAEGDWLWRVTWHDGTAYGVTYRTKPADTSEWTATLVSSRDGRTFQEITTFAVAGRPNETTLRFMPDGEMVALMRREAGSRLAWIGRSRAPYTSWTWRETPSFVGGPNFIRLADGELWASGRTIDQGKPTTVLARMTADGGYEPALTLPSGGDTSYAGMVWHDGLLWISYYASHEGKTAIYLARVKLPAT